MANITSIGWPEMFKGSTTKLLKDHDAVMNNLRLLLLSDKNSLLGDPYFGTNLKSVIYSLNNQALKDLVIDEIYTTIITFMPQLQLTRNNIKVYGEGETLYASISCINKLDSKPDLYTLELMKEEE